jgi:thioredoxin reductase (NADPH)
VPDCDASIYDVLVVGAGPAGLTAAIFACNKGLRAIVVEGLLAGGQLRSLYPQKPVYNYPGSSRIRAGELAEKMIAQVRQSGIPILENDPVRDLVPGPAGFRATLEDRQLVSKCVILACGMGLFNPRRLNVPGEDLLRDRAVFYTLDELAPWRAKRIAVIGGGNSAVDNALLLLEQDAEVSIIHWLPDFQAEAGSVEKLRQRRAEVLLGWSVAELSGNDDGQVSVVAEEARSKKRQTMTVDRVLVDIGVRPNHALLGKLPLARANQLARVDTEMRTSAAGLFACGDVVSYPGKTRLIVTALGEAATAVNSAGRYLKALEERRVAG